jgi:hypothetical protein
MADESVPADLRDRVIQRARGSCEYCRSQSRFATQSFSVEHIVPGSKGGTTTGDNLVLACQGCNNHKYIKVEALDLVTGQNVPLFHPRHERWEDHFAWNGDCTMVIGLTPIGRATVEALQLNREGLVNLRRAVYAIGEHPPGVEG